jgi:hypothetical protein
MIRPKTIEIVARAICKLTLSFIAKCNAPENTYLILIRQFLHCLPQNDLARLRLNPKKI